MRSILCHHKKSSLLTSNFTSRDTFSHFTSFHFILCPRRTALRVFPSLPDSRLRIFIAGQIQHRTVHRFLYTPAQVDAPCRLEAHYARNKKLKKCVFFFKEKSENCFFAYIAQHYLLQSMKIFMHVLSRMYSSSSSAFYAQNPACARND